MSTEKPTGLALLREEFPSHQISKLPKLISKDDQAKDRCQPGSKVSADGYHCGGWHARSIHLDYVGHAALTDRLLDADTKWSWEPVAFGPDGLPQLDKNGGLWIRLTVCGVTRLGYGDAQGKSGPNAVKEAIGDALRNAAMRFGAALDLWHKGDLHADDGDQEPSRPAVRGDAQKSAGQAAATEPSVLWQGMDDRTVRTAIGHWAKETGTALRAVEAAYAKDNEGFAIATTKDPQRLGAFLSKLRNGEIEVDAA